MQRAHILQSGFLAWATVDLVKSDAEDPSFKSSLYTPDYEVIDTVNYYDKGVEALFGQWRKDNLLVNTFAFREAILMTGFRVFREQSIVPWLRLQLSQSSLSYLHRRFLNDMVRSVMGQNQKTLDNFQYYRMLHPTLAKPSLSLEDRDVTTALSELFDGCEEDKRVSSLLYYWTRDIDGVIDLLTTMHVIFGKRSGPTTVATRTA